MSTIRPSPIRLSSLFSACISLILVLSGCQRHTGNLSRNNTSTISPRLQEVLAETRKACFGRLIVEVPTTAQIIYGPSQADFEIFYKPGEASRISDLVKERLRHIEERRDYLTADDKLKLPLYGQNRAGVRQGQRIVVGSEDQISYTVHSYVPFGNDLFIQYFDGVMPDQDPFEAANAVAVPLEARPNDVVPAAPGVCVDHGFIAKDMRYEQSTIGIRFKEFPDVHLSIDVHKNLEFVSTKNELEVSLKEGAQAAREDGKGYLFDQIKVFRHGPRRLGIWDGFEHASRMPSNQTNTDAHEFYFHAMGAADDRLLPALDIQLDSGVKGNTKAAVKPSITDEEALALWDAMIKTIRLRRPEDATPAKKEVPVGSISTSGEPCPATGWWQCRDRAGERPRLVPHGEHMPYLTQHAERNVWQKIMRETATMQVRTEWTLVEHA